VTIRLVNVTHETQHFHHQSFIPQRRGISRQCDDVEGSILVEHGLDTHFVVHKGLEAE